MVFGEHLTGVVRSKRPVLPDAGALLEASLDISPHQLSVVANVPSRIRTVRAQGCPFAVTAPPGCLQPVNVKSPVCRKQAGARQMGIRGLFSPQWTAVRYMLSLAVRGVYYARVLGLG